MVYAESSITGLNMNPSVFSTTPSLTSTNTMSFSHHSNNNNNNYHSNSNNNYFFNFSEILTPNNNQQFHLQKNLNLNLNLNNNRTTFSSSTEAPPGSSYELSTGEAAILGVVFVVFWLVSVLGNALVCLVIHRSRRTQSTTNYFVVSMATADLLLSLGAAPFILLQVCSGRWPLGSVACKAVRYLQHLCPGVQVNVLLCISVDRFYTIVFPLSFKVSREKAKKMILFSWILDAIFVSPCVFFYGNTNANAGHCEFFLPSTIGGFSYSVIHLFLGFFLPVILIILFYQRVVRHIWRINVNKDNALFLLRRTTNIVPRTKVKTIKMFLVLNSLFFCTWTPFYVAQLWHAREEESFITSHPNNSSSSTSSASASSSSSSSYYYSSSSSSSSAAHSNFPVGFFTAIAWISFSSTASKPTLYSVYNANFRRGMRETFCASSMKCYRSNAYTITASSRVAKKNYIGVIEINNVVTNNNNNGGGGGGGGVGVGGGNKTNERGKDLQVYETFERDTKEKKKVAWTINTTTSANANPNANPPNTFV